MTRGVILRKKLRVPIYDAVLHIGVYEDSEALTADMVRWFGKEILESGAAEGSAYCCRNGCGTFAVLFLRKHLCMNTLAHEVFHLTSRILDYYSVRHDPDNHEGSACLNGYLTEKVYAHVKKWVRR